MGINIINSDVEIRYSIYHQIVRIINIISSNSYIRNLKVKDIKQMQ